MEFVDYKIMSDNIPNNSLVLIFKNMDENFINMNIQNAIFEKFNVYNSYLKDNENLNIFNQFIVIEDNETNIFYFIQLITKSDYLKQFERNMNNLRLSMLSYIYKYNLNSIYTYNPYSDNKKEIFFDILNSYSNDIKIKICNFDV